MYHWGRESCMVGKWQLLVMANLALFHTASVHPLVCLCLAYCWVHYCAAILQADSLLVISTIQTTKRIYLVHLFHVKRVHRTDVVLYFPLTSHFTSQKFIFHILLRSAVLMSRCLGVFLQQAVRRHIIELQYVDVSGGFPNGGQVTVDYSEYPRFEYSEQWK